MEGPHFPIIACSFVAFHSGTGVVVIAIVVINTINAAAAAAAAALVTVGAAHCHSSSLGTYLSRLLVVSSGFLLNVSVVLNCLGHF